MHGGRTRAEDHAIVTIRFDGNRMGLVEASWAKPGGMDDRAEIVGSRGITYADLMRGSSLSTYSDVGYGYAVEKAPDTRGWTFTIFDELWNSGIPQEMDHFVSCVLDAAIPAGDRCGRPGGTRADLTRPTGPRVLAEWNFRWNSASRRPRSRRSHFGDNSSAHQ